MIRMDVIAVAKGEVQLSASNRESNRKPGNPKNPSTVSPLVERIDRD
jgi:hypothetical protein